MSRQEAVLELRRRILQFVARFPGIHVRELARMLDRSQPLVDYHITAMTEQGLLRGERMDQYLRLYPAVEADELTDTERRTLGMLRDRRVLHIVLWMLGHGGPARNADVSKGTGMAKSLASFHLAKLVDSRLIRHKDEEYSLADPKLVRRLLSRHQPTPDLREEFSDLWEALYDD